jgi:hypothetical protein
VRSRNSPKQPRVLHRDDRLRREVLQQRDLLVGKGALLLTVDADHAEQDSVLAQRDDQEGADAAALDP